MGESLPHSVFGNGQNSTSACALFLFILHISFCNGGNECKFKYCIYFSGYFHSTKHRNDDAKRLENRNYISFASYHDMSILPLHYAKVIEMCLLSLYHHSFHLQPLVYKRRIAYRGNQRNTLTAHVSSMYITKST